MHKEALEAEIKKVAYELYEKSGCIPGRDLENWLEAEKIVLSKYGLLKQKEASTALSEKKEKAKRGRRSKKS